MTRYDFFENPLKILFGLSLGNSREVALGGDLLLILVTPAVKGAGPWLKAGVDLEVLAEGPLDESQRCAPSTLQVVLRVVCGL